MDQSRFRETHISTEFREILRQYMEPKDSLQHSKHPTTNTYADVNSAHTLQSDCLKIHFLGTSAKRIVNTCRDRVSSCNIYAVQQDTQSVLMSKFIQHLW